MNTTGKRIKKIRIELHLTQEQLGKQAGVTKAAVSQWEREITSPERDPLLSLQRNLSINPEWVTDGTGEMFNKKNQNTIKEETANYSKGVDRIMFAKAYKLTCIMIKKHKINPTEDEIAGMTIDFYEELLQDNNSH